ERWWAQMTIVGAVGALVEFEAHRARSLDVIGSIGRDPPLRIDQIIDSLLLVPDQACEDDAVEFDPVVDGFDAVGELLELRSMVVEVTFEGGE
ncbi:MAG: hypothetical protein Q9228_003708, partial [Teloschistes exilis]